MSFFDVGRKSASQAGCHYLVCQAAIYFLIMQDGVVLNHTR